MKYQLLGIDEGRQRLMLLDTSDAGSGWNLDLSDFPLARDLQRLDAQRALVGYDHGFFEIEIATGRVLKSCNRWRNVTAACRLPDGGTLVTGQDLEGESESVCVLTLDRNGVVTQRARRDGDYVRLMRPNGEGGYLLSTNDHICETDAELRTIRTLAAPGFEHAWLAQREADGGTLVSAGYGAFMARFDAAGKLAGSFGRAEDVPAEAAPFFYASFQHLPQGGLLVANWQGHGPDNGDKGRQLIEFDADGGYVDGWSDAGRISSLQGILLL